MNNIRLNAVLIKVSGQVQGVFFRATTQTTAKNLRLSGWVRNRNDGSVEIRAEGNRHQLEKLIEWCQDGPPYASVSEVKTEWVAHQGLKDFHISR